MSAKIVFKKLSFFNTDRERICILKTFNLHSIQVSNCSAGQVYCCSSSSGHLTDTCGFRKITETSHPKGQASYGAYPWQAALLTKDNAYVGSGMLITPDHVLTVAHKVAPYTYVNYIYVLYNYMLNYK